jgi:hypothetical protein
VQLTSHPLFHPLTSIRSARQWLIDMPRRSEAYVAKISLQPVTVTTAAPVDSAVMSRVGVRAMLVHGGREGVCFAPPY